MVNRLCKITLSVKDYQTQQKGSFTYNGVGQEVRLGQYTALHSATFTPKNNVILIPLLRSPINLSKKPKNSVGKFLAILSKSPIALILITAPLYVQYAE